MRWKVPLKRINREKLLNKLTLKESHNSYDLNTAITYSRNVGVSVNPFYDPRSAIVVDLYHNIYSWRLTNETST